MKKEYVKPTMEIETIEFEIQYMMNTISAPEFSDDGNEGNGQLFDESINEGIWAW